MCGWSVCWHLFFSATHMRVTQELTRAVISVTVTIPNCLCAIFFKIVRSSSILSGPFNVFLLVPGAHDHRSLATFLVLKKERLTVILYCNFSSEDVLMNGVSSLERVCSRPHATFLHLGRAMKDDVVGSRLKLMVSSEQPYRPCKLINVFQWPEEHFHKTDTFSAFLITVLYLTRYLRHPAAPRIDVLKSTLLNPKCWSAKKRMLLFSGQIRVLQPPHRTRSHLAAEHRTTCTYLMILMNVLAVAEFILPPANSLGGV